MTPRIEEMMQDIETMKARLREEIAKEEKKIAYTIKNGSVVFEEALLQRQRQQMKQLGAWFREIPFIQLLTAPVIYGMMIPAVILDLSLWIYKIIVGKVFNIKFAERKDYIVFDRHYLGYLNIIEKINCVYCSYFNGLMNYAVAIAGRTELYFCPIKHAKKVAYEHPFSYRFFSYADGESYQERLKRLREETAKK